MITINFEKTPCLLEVEQLLNAKYGQGFTIPNEMWAGIYFYCHYGLPPQKIAENIMRNQLLKDILDFLKLKLENISPLDVEKLRELIVNQGEHPNSSIEQVFPNRKLTPFKP